MFLIHQWFLKFFRYGLLRFVNVFRLLRNQFWSLLSVSTSTAPAISKLRASACRQLPSLKSNKIDQSTCNMNMSDYSCDAIKFLYDPRCMTF